VSAFEPHVRRSDWKQLESRVASSVERLLELMAEFEVRGTFFVLGWIGKRHPDVVKAIVRGGHEIASHGWGHVRVTRQTPGLFRECVGASKSLLEDLSGQAVIGYRAPSFSITRGREWALDILAEEGYRYDSSLFPVIRHEYGYANGSRDPHVISRRKGDIMEFPPATVRALGVNIPAAGGGYLRLLPYGLVRRGLLAAERRGAPGMFYIHPWELDPEQPRIAASWHARLRHYGGLRRTVPRLRRLMTEFDFQPVEDTLSETTP